MPRLVNGSGAIPRLWLVAALLAGAGCGKKGPPFVPLKVKQEVYRYVRVAPARGGVLVSWQEADVLPKPSEGKSWSAYHLSRKNDQDQVTELKTVKVTGEGGLRYEHLDLQVTAGRTYRYSLKLVSDRQKTVFLYPDLPIVPGGGPPSPEEVAGGAGDAQVALTWKAVPRERFNGREFLGYNIFRRPQGKEYDYRTPLNPQPLSETAYLDRTAVNEAVHCYTVTLAVSGSDGVEEGPPSAEVCATPQDTTPPDAPAGLTSAWGGEMVILSWRENAESDLGGYRVYRRGEEEGFVLISRTLLRSAFYRDATAAHGQTYYYAVTAVDASPRANESAYSDILRLNPQ